MSNLEKIADYIINSQESKEEIIWLLKKSYKDNNKLAADYKDVLKNAL